MICLATASAAATLVATLSAVAAIGSFLAYVYFVQRSNANAAREEALALAETRREVIADLRARLEAGGQRIGELQTALDDARSESREQAYQMQRLYATGLADLLEGVRGDLEAVPPNAQRALRRVHELLARQQPAA
jgi:hypothetical protein